MQWHHLATILRRDRAVWSLALATWATLSLEHFLAICFDVDLDVSIWINWTTLQGKLILLNWRVISIVGKIKVSISDHYWGPVGSSLHHILAWSYHVHWQYWLFLPELIPEAIPFELCLHLEFLIKYTHLCLRCNRLHLSINLFGASFPKNHDVHRLSHCNSCLSDIKVNRDFLLVCWFIHFISKLII